VKTIRDWLQKKAVLLFSELPSFYPLSGLWFKPAMNEVSQRLISMSVWSAIFLFCCLLMDSQAIAADHVVGKIQLMSGDSWILKGDQSKVDAKKGMLLEARDTVVTGDRGRVKLLMLDGTTLFVSRNSRLEAKRYALVDDQVDEAKLDLFWGKVRFRVKHLTTSKASFQMRTTTAVMGIRGTSGIFASTMLPSDAQIRLRAQSLQSIPERPSQLVLTSGLVSMKSLISGNMSLIRAGETAMINVRGALRVRPSRQRDLHLLPESGMDDTQDSSSPSPSVMPAPPVEHDVKNAAVGQAKETLHQQKKVAVGEKKVSSVVKTTGHKAVTQAQQQAQVQVQQKISGQTSIQIQPVIVGP